MLSGLVAVFDQYQKSRMLFVKTVADLATRSQNIEFLQNAGQKTRRNSIEVCFLYVFSSFPFSPAAGVMPLLHPLMLDVVPGIQQTAARALGHLADQSEDMAAAVVRQDILPQMVRSLSRQNVNTSCWLYRISKSCYCCVCAFLKTHSYAKKSWLVIPKYWETILKNTLKLVD